VIRRIALSEPHRCEPTPSSLADMSRIPVPVTRADFDTDRKGWRVPLLAVPGAKIVAMYAEGELPPTAYRADSDDGFVQWVKDTPPPAAATFTVDVAADQLSRKSDTDFWKFMTAVCTPVAGAIAAGITAFLAHKTPPPPPSKPLANAWTISGKVAIPPGVLPDEVYPLLRPPDLRLGEDSSFSGTILLGPNASGEPTFPNLVFVVVKHPRFAPTSNCVDDDEYGTEVVRLHSPEAAPVYGEKPLALNFNAVGRTIGIAQPVAMTALPKCSHNPQAAPPTPAQTAAPVP
jgi:hypothetical protein